MTKVAAETPTPKIRPTSSDPPASPAAESFLNLVLGVTGPNAAGKGEVSSYLACLGFAIHSLSDIVREEAASRGLPPEREHLIRVGNELRAAGGAGVLAERIVPRLGKRDVVDSIRNPAEVVVLRRVPGFVLVGVTADPAVRYQRSRQRARPGDPATFEQFLARERQENLTDPTGQQLDATFRLADRILANDGGLDQLRASIESLLASLQPDRSAAV